MDYVKNFLALVNGVKLITLAILIIADFILGVIVALKSSTFKLNKIASFLNTSVLGMVGGYFIVGVIATAEPSFETMVTASWAAIDAALLAMIINKLKALGLPIPDSLLKWTGGSTSTPTLTATTNAQTTIAPTDTQTGK